MKENYEKLISDLSGICLEFEEKFNVESTPDKWLDISLHPQGCIIKVGGQIVFNNTLN